MNRYGSDKPDLRLRPELTELTDYFAGTPFRVFQAPYVGAVVQKGGASTPRRGFDAWQEWAKQRGARGLAYVTDRRRRHPRRSGGQEHLRGRAGRAGRGGRRRARRRGVLRRRRPPRRPGAARRGPAGDRPARRADRRERLGVLLGGRRAAVRAHRRDRRRDGRRRGQHLDRGAPRVHLAQARVAWTPSTPIPGRRWPTPTTSSATATRSAAGRSVSTAPTSSSGCSR